MSFCCIIFVVAEGVLIRQTPSGKPVISRAQYPEYAMRLSLADGDG